MRKFFLAIAFAITLLIAFAVSAPTAFAVPESPTIATTTISNVAPVVPIFDTVLTLSPSVAIPVSVPADTRAGQSREAEVSSSFLIIKNLSNLNTLANGGMGQKFLYRLNT